MTVSPVDYSVAGLINRYGDQAYHKCSEIMVEYAMGLPLYGNESAVHIWSALDDLTRLGYHRNPRT